MVWQTAVLAARDRKRGCEFGMSTLMVFRMSRIIERAIAESQCHCLTPRPCPILSPPFGERLGGYRPLPDSIETSRMAELDSRLPPFAKYAKDGAPTRYGRIKGRPSAPLRGRRLELFRHLAAEYTGVVAQKCNYSTSMR